MIFIYRMYWSYDHASIGLDQNKVPTPKQYHVSRSKVCRREGLCQEDVPSGGTFLILERSITSNTCWDTKEGMEVFHLWAVSETFPVWKRQTRSFGKFLSILSMNVFFFPPQTYSLAGLGSGVTEAIIVNPFEVVKVKMQSNRSHQSQTPSTWY